jgi:hypothetical protein
MTDFDPGKPVLIGDKVIGQLAGDFIDYDGLIEALRALQISTALGVKGMFVTDAALLQMQPLCEKRDEIKAHARRRAPLGENAARRAERDSASAGRLGGKLAPRSERARLAAKARWQSREWWPQRSVTNPSHSFR